MGVPSVNIPSGQKLAWLFRDGTEKLGRLCQLFPAIRMHQVRAEHSDICGVKAQFINRVLKGNILRMAFELAVELRRVEFIALEIALKF